jgi:hypothetical protein
VKTLAISLVAIIMLLSGCVGYTEPNEPPSIPVPNQTEVVLPKDPPMDKTWVSPGKIEISNFYPGARAEYPITIHNGKDTETLFSVAYRYPDNVATGYDKPNYEAQDWVMVVDTTPILAPKETRDILVVLSMPKEAKIDSDKWEFWISVMDMTQKGQIRTELCVRWLISMR